MRILVLRPEPAAARTAGRLAALGHEAVSLPLSKAEHDLEATRQALRTPHAAIAVTSAEMARLFEELGDIPRATVFAVGPATAEAMQKTGFSAVLAASGDGESLAALIAAHYREKARPSDPILYLAGNPRAPGFETRLAETGIPFRTVEAYRMTPRALTRTEIETALLHPAPDAALVMHHHFEHDREALVALAETAIPFIGLLGPVRRREDLLRVIPSALHASLLARLHSPIGLKLGGQGPEAIALSIAAQLQAWHHGEPA